MTIMAYQRIRQPKLSDVIEQELERLIVEGTLSPGQQLPPERELASNLTYLALRLGKRFSV